MKPTWIVHVIFMTFSLGLLSPAAAAPPDSVDLAGRIDKHVAAGWAAAKVTPAATADDAKFLRRVYLDLVGHIPAVAEVREFLADKAADKRTKLVLGLVDSAAHGRHAAVSWRREWLPEVQNPPPLFAAEFEDWFARQFRDGVPYDRIVTDLLRGSPNPFLVAAEQKPETLAANTTRAFLGLNLDCAQCHDHPFARWKQEQFWQTAAFFSRPKMGRFEIAIPDSRKTAAARLLTGTQPEWPVPLKEDTGRTTLAAWVTAKENPYFARNAVNRLWARLFGTGLVEPLDDLSGDNPPSHPELLDEVAKAFAEGGYDLKSLTAALVLTKAYQLSSAGEREPRLFASAPVRGLSGEQLYDSLRIAAGLPGEYDPRERSAFVEKFRIERAVNAQRSILQALSLMNGDLTAKLTSPEKTPTLRSVATAPFLDTKDKVEALFLATLGRKPRDDESRSLVEHVEKGEPRKALADVFWALINSSEFNTNH